MTAPNTSPVFTNIPTIGFATFSGVVSGRSQQISNANIKQIVAGAANGTRVDKIQFKAAGSTVAGMVGLWESEDGGTTYNLLTELQVAAITGSTTSGSWEGFMNFLPVLGLEVPSGKALGVSTTIAQTFNAFALGGTF